MGEYREGGICISSVLPLISDFGFLCLHAGKRSTYVSVLFPRYCFIKKKKKCYQYLKVLVATWQHVNSSGSYQFHFY